MVLCCVLVLCDVLVCGCDVEVVDGGGGGVGEVLMCGGVVVLVNVRCVGMFVVESLDDEDDVCVDGVCVMLMVKK